MTPREPKPAKKDASPSQGERAAASAPRQGVEEAGELRHLTVMFCDLVRWTEVSRALDDEALLDIIGRYYETCKNLVGQFQGHIHQFLGDGILSSFVSPRARGRPRTRRRAGLSIVSELERINPQLESEYGVRLRVRIGIHTGDVVIGEPGSGEMMALGHTVNLADRIQRVAEPDSVVISRETARLVEGLFVTHDLGPQSLKGITAPMPVFRVVGRAKRGAVWRYPSQVA